MRILVTGGSGFIAGHFYPALAASGWDCVAYDCHPPAPDLPDHVEFVRGDIRDGPALTQAMRGADAVLHLAAAHHDFGIDEATFFDVNEEGSRVLCASATEAGVDTLCFYSTVAVYGSAPPPVTEDSRPRPTTPYGASKLAGERVVRDWAEAVPGRYCLVVRPTVVIGPGHFANLFTLARQIESRRFLPVGRGENAKSLCYVDNLIQATRFLMWGERADRPAFECFNYVDKPDLTSRQIITAVYEELGRRMPRWRVPYLAARAAALPLDVVIALTGWASPISGARIRKLARAETVFEAEAVRKAGFHAPVSLRQGIQRFVAWYREAGREQRPRRNLPPPVGTWRSAAFAVRGRD